MCMKHLHFLLVLGLWPLHHTCYLHWDHLHGSVQDDQTKILDLGLFKLALLWFEVELVLAEAFQDEASDLMVLLHCFSVDEDIVEVYAHYALCNEVLEDVVHHGLEGGGAVGKSEEHNKQLEQSLVGLEGSLPLISLLDIHVVAPPDVQFSEVPHTPEVVDELRDEEEGVVILYCHGIENPVILNQLE
ncbi:hypothetical protein C0989_005591 [Termitomyces sp. Mn162]|nr:hypothetical protein C0989_005591 [Termitomyces sp. Mn162]